METAALERARAAQVVRRRHLLSAYVGYFVFIPQPLILLGRFQWAGVAMGLFVLYAYFTPTLGAASKEEIDEVLREQASRRQTEGGGVVSMDAALYAKMRHSQHPQAAMAARIIPPTDERSAPFKVETSMLRQPKSPSD
jgi:uncharacterized iron-regulated membrane protein